MGYPTELFESSNVKDEFLCSICRDVLQDPVMVDPCEYTFCKVCIQSWSTSRVSAPGLVTCPYDRRPIQGLKPPPRIYTNLLNGLRLRCRFRQAGCKASLTLGEVETHKTRCEFNPDAEIRCGQGCEALIKRARIAEHNCVAFLVGVVKAVQLDADKKVGDALLAYAKVDNELKATKYELRALKEEQRETKNGLSRIRF